jgi:competence protein ComEC
LLVLLFRPEALAGASFQMSFAAVTAIVALHSTVWARRLLQRREEGLAGRVGRWLAGMVLTGLAVEVALIPLALFHFHRAGLYGVAANIVAIPLTTFVIMPLEAGALLLDALGVGAPLWAACGAATGALLALAHWVASSSGAVAMMPSMPAWAFAAMVAGGLWLCLWVTRLRLLGVVPLAAGMIGAGVSSTPDLLVSSDGRHLAVVRDGVPLLLRERAGDYLRNLFAEASGFDGHPGDIASTGDGSCSRDSCVARLREAGNEWRVLAIRSSTRIEWAALTQACAEADIVVAERRLPRGCKPRWLKLDRGGLARTGGVAVYLGSDPRVVTVASGIGAHPWAATVPSPRSTPPVRSRPDR